MKKVMILICLLLLTSCSSDVDNKEEYVAEKDIVLSVSYGKVHYSRSDEGIVASRDDISYDINDILEISNIYTYIDVNQMNTYITHIIPEDDWSAYIGSTVTLFEMISEDDNSFTESNLEFSMVQPDLVIELEGENVTVQCSFTANEDNELYTVFVVIRNEAGLRAYNSFDVGYEDILDEFEVLIYDIEN